MNNLTQYQQVQEKYWKQLCQLKFDLLYYDLHFRKCVMIGRFIKIIGAIMTSFATGAWMGWNHIGWVRIVCPIVIFVLQAMNAGYQFFPFEDRKIELRELIEKLELIYYRIEYNWVQVAAGSCTKERIRKLIYENVQEITKEKSRYFRNDSLPQNKRITQKAKVIADNYFKNF